jgi:glycosyltransferase involved in cell wall biosynthesis
MLLFPSAANKLRLMIRAEDSNGFFLLLNADPPVIYMLDWVFDAPKPVHWLQLQALAGRRAHLLVQLSWTHESKGVFENRVRRVESYTSLNRGHKVTILANTQNEFEAFASRGIDALFCNGTVFLSGSLFHPIPGCRKEYRAVYDAAISPYKRHLLAKNIRDLALISYVKHDSNRNYVQKVVKALAQATWLNGVPNQQTWWLTQQDVNQYINRAHVGLCLSAKEGMMYASAQYLLAGLPIVTTASKGGRDIFYDPSYVRIVEDDPAVIASAVEEFCAAPPSVELIRQSTLERFQVFRSRFARFMQELLYGHDLGGLWNHGWPEGLPDKMNGSGFSFQSNIAALTKPGQAAPWLATCLNWTV